MWWISPRGCSCRSQTSQLHSSRSSAREPRLTVQFHCAPVVSYLLHLPSCLHASLQQLDVHDSYFCASRASLCYVKHRSVFVSGLKMHRSASASPTVWMPSEVAQFRVHTNTAHDGNHLSASEYSPHSIIIVPTVWQATCKLEWRRRMTRETAAPNHRSALQCITRTKIELVRRRYTTQSQSCSCV